MEANLDGTEQKGRDNLHLHLPIHGAKGFKS
jgi:hypothetical protein